MKKICRHCQAYRAIRPRGLCWTCYYKPGVREQYLSESRYGRRGVDDFCGKGALPPAPTSARPGSPEKIAILTQRAQARQALWHPLDGIPLAPTARPALAEVG